MDRHVGYILLLVRCMKDYNRREISESQENGYTYDTYKDGLDKDGLSVVSELVCKNSKANFRWDKYHHSLLMYVLLNLENVVA